MAYEHIKIEYPTTLDKEGNVVREGTVDGNYAVIVINRPDRLNALTTQTLSEITGALRELELDPSVRAVVIRGTKDFTKKPAFSAGADLASGMGDNLDPSIPMNMALAMRLKHREYDEMEQFSKPLVAAVDGFALGGGFEIVLCCDIVIASDRSRLGLPEVNRGIFPANGGVTRLARIIGLNRALQVSMFGELHSAETMRDWGLVSWVAPAGDEFEELVHEKAKWLGESATTALSIIKQCNKFGSKYAELGMIM
jgi:enoyl-CoA hydratase/carnithine racemase